MTRILLAAALAAAAALPAAAQQVQVLPGPIGAIQHFNQSAEQRDRVSLPRAERKRTALPSRSFEIARRIVNQSADSQDGKILGRGTVFND